MAKQTQNLITPFGRVSFPSLFVPRAPQNEGAKPKYEVTLVFFPGEMDEAQKDLLQKLVVAANDLCLSEFKCNLKDGVVKNPFVKTETKPDYYPPGGLFVRFMSYQKPGVVGPDKRPFGPDEARDLYAGCWARVSCSPRSFNMNGNRGVGFWLQNLQKVRDDERWGGYSSPDEDFDAVAVADPMDDIAF